MTAAAPLIGRVVDLNHTEERGVPRVDRHLHPIRVHHLEGACRVVVVVAVMGGARIVAVRAKQPGHASTTASLEPTFICSWKVVTPSLSGYEREEDWQPIVGRQGALGRRPPDRGADLRPPLLLDFAAQDNKWRAPPLLRSTIAERTAFPKCRFTDLASAKWSYCNYIAAKVAILQAMP
jgi:hypothetical protein